MNFLIPNFLNFKINSPIPNELRYIPLVIFFSNPPIILDISIKAVFFFMNINILFFFNSASKILNLFNDKSIVASRPAGVRPNMPRTFSIGFLFDF